MSDTLARVRTQVQEDSVRVSEHGYDELADDELSAREIIEGVAAATAIEDYPTFPQRALRAPVTTRQRRPAGTCSVGYSSRAVLAGRVGNRLSAGFREMDRQLYAEKDMNTRQRTKYIHEGKYVAEVKVELIEDEQGWSPYLSKQDAYRLDEVRAALKRGDLAAATKTAKVFSLTPVAV